MILIRGKVALRLLLVLIVFVVGGGGGVVVVSGCGETFEDAAKLSQTIPAIPSNTDFGSLYPKLNALLNRDVPDVYTAVRETRDWAESHLNEFSTGSCARTQVLYDRKFADNYGPWTLGVTLPWMQIFVRDGRRSTDTFIWQDVSLFVGTILHEYVHAIQRARQSKLFLLNNTNTTNASCESARNALSTKFVTWSAGFSALKTSRTLDDSFNFSDKALLYRWVSPIERARDELEAAVLTLQWMAQFPDELNVMTMGGATNWSYGSQYLDLLRTLATSNCFSADEGVFTEEQRIYNEEIPAFASVLAQHQEAMNLFLNRHGREPAVQESIMSLVVPPAPRGHDGHACVGLDRSLPSFPFADNDEDLHSNIEMQGLPLCPLRFE